MPASFFDTNVLVYLASGDAAKADREEAAIADGGSISAQVGRRSAFTAGHPIGGIEVR
jgi:predicted nucleic acid-binding protein